MLLYFVCIDMKPIWNILNIGWLTLGLLGGYRSTELGSLTHANPDPMLWLVILLSRCFQSEAFTIRPDAGETFSRVLHGIGIPSPVIILFDVLHGDDGNRGCIATSCDWLGRFLDGRKLQQQGNWTRGPAALGLSDLSSPHRQGIAPVSLTDLKS